MYYTDAEHSLSCTIKQCSDCSVYKCMLIMSINIALPMQINYIKNTIVLIIVYIGLSTILVLLVRIDYT